MTSTASPNVLIVEDNDLTRGYLADNLRADGLAPIEAASRGDARRLILSAAPALLMLDLSLPSGEGLDLLDELRCAEQPLFDPDLPVLALSRSASELDCVRGLSRGADDFLAAPFGYPELLARVRALLRRAAHRPRRVRVRVGTLELDLAGRQARVEGELVHLSRTEFALARLLASDPARTFTRAELLSEIWGFDAGTGRTRTLDTHASRLRRKLSGGRMQFVSNVWGVGYRLHEGAGDEPSEIAGLAVSATG